VSESKVLTWIQEALGQDFFDADIQRDVAWRRAFLDGRFGELEYRVRQMVRDEFEQLILEEPEPEPKPKRRRQLSCPTTACFEPLLRMKVADAVKSWNVTVAGIARAIPMSRNTLELHLARHHYKQPGETTLQTLRRLADEWHPGWRQGSCRCTVCEPGLS